MTPRELAEHYLASADAVRLEAAVASAKASRDLLTLQVAELQARPLPAVLNVRQAHALRERDAKFAGLQLRIETIEQDLIELRLSIAAATKLLT